MSLSLLGWLFALGVVAHNAEEALLNLPLSGWLVYRSLAERYVEPSVFVVSGPATVLGTVASIPLLFTIGRKLSR